MALTENYKMKDGITIGGPQDLCYKCELIRKANDIDSDIPYGKLQYEEVFKINRNGIETCICLDHLKQLINESKRYELVDKTQYMIIPNEVMDNSEEETAKTNEEESVDIKEEIQEHKQEEIKEDNKKKTSKNKKDK